MNLSSSTKTKERHIDMRQIEASRQTRKGKHLNWEERIQIETLHRQGVSSEKIGLYLGRPVRTISREIRRGWVLHRLSQYAVEERYSAQRGQTLYDERMRSRTPPEPIDERLKEHLYEQIIEKTRSPEVIADRMKKKQLDYAVCAKTIYNLIDRGLIPGVSNESLWEKHKRKQKRRTLCRKRKRPIPPGRSIENRPESIDNRTDAGHWEIDLVVGGQGKGPAVLLTLTERKTRKEIIRKLKDKTQRAVIRAMNGIERQMGKEAFKAVFKSITADNGSEFLDCEALEASVLGASSRTRIYYAHPYSSWERGSNENANRIIRRFIPKGCDIAKFTHKQIQNIEEWINNYPRKILNFKTAEEMFIEELAA
jgi:IS30 family transposase